VNEEPTIKGDKLRRAIFLVWLSNQFNEKLSYSELGRMVSYTSSGLYTGKEGGWFIENMNGELTLTDKSELYLQKNQLEFSKLIRILLAYMVIIFVTLLVQHYVYYEYDFLLMFNRATLIFGIVIMFLLYHFWYRILWIAEKISYNRTK
jgi:hypothetical protein